MNDQLQRRHAQPWPGTRQIFLEFGMTTPPKKVKTRLEISDQNQKVLRIKRIRTGNGEPIGIQDSYLDLPDGKEISRD